jgi:hypothetical protein
MFLRNVGLTTRKIVLFVVAAVRSSNLSKLFLSLVILPFEVLGVFSGTDGVDI